LSADGASSRATQARPSCVGALASSTPISLANDATGGASSRPRSGFRRHHAVRAIGAEQLVVMAQRSDGPLADHSAATSARTTRSRAGD
jgi:hypothetical protein